MSDYHSIYNINLPARQSAEHEAYLIVRSQKIQALRIMNEIPLLPVTI